MSELTAVQRGDMVEALLPEAAGLVVDVHEGSADDIKTRLMGLTRHELEAVAVLLAALASPEQGLQEALAWVDFDEYGDRIPPSRAGRSVKSIGEMAPQMRRQLAGVDVVAVNRSLAPDNRGQIPLTRAERRLAVQVGIRRGLQKAEVALRLGMSEDAVDQSWHRNKRKDLAVVA